MRTLMIILWGIVCLLVIGAFVDVAYGRDPAQVREFRKTHACPATGKLTGACPGWVVDHMIPLCAGGPDDPINMQWQDEATSFRKDIQERALCKRMQSCPQTH